MPIVFSQMRSVIVKPLCVYIQEYDLRVYINADIHNGDEGTVTLGKYNNKMRALEVLEEMFKSEYYEMPLE